MKTIWIILWCMCILIIGSLRIAWAFFYQACSFVDQKVDAIYNWILK